MEPDLQAKAQGDADTPMNGTLEDTTPAGVLQVLSSQRKTGAVRFLGDAGCTVYLDNGELYFAESTETAEDLAVALVRPGRLTGDEWDSCTESGYPTDSVGEALIETGSITRDLLASIVLSVIYDPLIQLFRAPEGDYEFAPDVMHWIGPYRCFSVDAIVSEVRRRTREADEMAPLIPSLDAVVQTARTMPDSRGSVNLRRDDWEVVVAAAPGRTVRELAIELGRGRWSTARLVYRLATGELLTVTPGEPSIHLGDATAVTSSFDSLATPSGPPPLDVGAFAPEDETSTESDSWMMPERADNSGWGLAEPTADASTADSWGVAEPETEAPATDSWGVTEPETDSWGVAEPETDDSSSDSWLAGEVDDAASWRTESSFSSTSESEASVSDWEAGSLSAVPDLDESDESFDAPALHPDIAKALAESTYADSATAINAMAARLSAADSDDDDDWDNAGGSGGDEDDFWSSDGGDGSGESFDFIWKPAVWETGVESAPLPQRGGMAQREPAMADPVSAVGTVDDHRSIEPEPGAGDPGWLDNLYTQFMPGEGGKDAPAATSPGGDATAEPAPKQRSIRRLMSAFKRL